MAEQLSRAPRHRAEARPRWGRITALAGSITVTLVAVLGGWGVLPADDVARDAAPAAAAAVVQRPVSTPSATPTASATASAATSVGSAASAAGPAAAAVSAPAGPPPVPAGTGTGKRIVFSETDQRVWLVDEDDTVERTYLASGSVLDNLQPGTYEVYSKSRWAVGIDDSGVMEYFVRFTRGPSGAAIGFHTIPTKNGEPLQTRAQLGTPQSHGCIRQRTADAIALWDFAPLGTTVVVV